MNRFCSDNEVSIEINSQIVKVKDLESRRILFVGKESNDLYELPIVVRSKDAG